MYREAEPQRSYAMVKMTGHRVERMTLQILLWILAEVPDQMLQKSYNGVYRFMASLEINYQLRFIDVSKCLCHRR